MKILKLFLVLFVSLLFLKASFAQTDIIKEQTFETNYGKDLTVSAPSGDINITTWNKEQVYVKISGNENAKKIYDFTINSNSGNIEVKAEKKDNGKESNIKLNVEISVPENFNVKVSTAGGDIKITNSLTGETNLNTAGGDIEVGSVTGECKLNTAGGDIDVISFKGDLKANTAGGDIKLNGSDGEVIANTSGGKIDLTYKGENKEITLNSMGGDIILSLPSDFKADCKLMTMNGEIKSDITITGEKTKDDQVMKNLVAGKMNGGGKSLKCSSISGNVFIKSF